MAKALQILAGDKSIQVILINLLGSIPQAGEVAEVITNYLREQHNQFSSNGTKNRRKSFSCTNLVIRLAGSDLDVARKYLSNLKMEGESHILLVESLDEAVKQAVRLTKNSHKK